MYEQTVKDPGECFAKTKINFKFDLTMACRSCHCLLSPFTGIGLSKDVQIMVKKSTEYTFLDDSLLKENILSKDHNGKSKQWHDWPAIVKSNLKSILVFVKHPPPPPPLNQVKKKYLALN